MCGFAGEFSLKDATAPARVKQAQAMAAVLRHRGPDEQSDFLSLDQRCALGFQRLAVIDPLHSKQPMSLSNNEITIAFNGEIYNFRDLRRGLADQGDSFTTSGDTEVLLHMYRRYGLSMFEHLQGMFALAIYDQSAMRLVLARDRLGEKPLWYSVLGDRIIFASEAKALLQHERVDKSWSPTSLAHYMTVGYVHHPLTIWKNIHKLSPAHFMVIGDQVNPPQRYWSPQPVQLPASHGDQVALVRHTIRESVESQLVSDVPLGALLSGGVDSSIVVALMAKAAGRAGGVRTFTAGFDNPLFDERAGARLVASHCGTDHTELLITPDPKSVLGDMVRLYDEPFADSSAIPTYLICQAARQHVTVALTGDGGDEMFAGYDRYRALHLADRLSPAKFLAIKMAAAVLRPFAPHEERSRLRRMIRFSEALLYPYAQQYFMHRSLFDAKDLGRLFTEDFARQADVNAPCQWFCELYEEGDFEDEVARSQHHDMMTYLSDDLLVKSDIASMANSLELRAPMLDYRLPGIGLALPVEMKIRDGHGKAVLREAFADLLPPQVFEGPKRGFGVPMGDWLRKDLAVEMRDTLLDPAFLGRGIFRKEALFGLMNDHALKRDDHRHRLWALLVFARWIAHNGL